MARADSGPTGTGAVSGSTPNRKRHALGVYRQQRQDEHQPRFDDAMDFQPNGLAVVAEHGQFGLIDKTAHYIVQPMYDSIGSFSEGRAVVIDKQGFKLIDEKGNVLTKRAYPFLAELRTAGRSSM